MILLVVLFRNLVVLLLSVLGACMFLSEFVLVTCTVLCFCRAGTAKRSACSIESRTAAIKQGNFICSRFIINDFDLQEKESLCVIRLVTLYVIWNWEVFHPVSRKSLMAMVL